MRDVVKSMEFIFSFLKRSLTSITMIFKHVTFFIGFGSIIDPKQTMFVQVFVYDRLMFNTKLKNTFTLFWV